MKKFPSNTYEKHKMYNDILLNNNTNNFPSNKTNIKKPHPPVNNNINNKNKSSTTSNSNLSSSNLNFNNNSTNTQNETQTKEIQKFKSEENKQDLKEDKEKNDLKEQKPKVQRIKLDEKTLFYSENGLKKFYDAIAKTSFKDNKSEFNKLNKLIQIYKNWHFMLFPKYNIDFFTSKITDLGKKPPGRAYMSRLRKIYKGEENWDVLYNQQDEILNIDGKNKINSTDVNAISPISSKIFSEDVNNTINNAYKSKATFTNLTSKLHNVSLSNNVKISKGDDHNIDEIQNLVFQNVEVDQQDNNHNMYDVNEEDYMNFDDIHNDDDGRSKADSFMYKNEKRNFVQAFGDKPIDNNEELDIISSKKMKLS